MHIHQIEGDNGNLQDVVPFCCDSCHREWCEATGETYGGWNGCHEGGDSSEFCAMCGVICWPGEDACDCQINNVVVGRFPREEGEKCECGHWLQLPMGHLSVYDV